MRYKKLIAVVATLSVFCGVVVASNTHATGITDEINITIPTSCSLTSVVGSAHTATIETGVYQESIGETTFKVFCNDSEGFSVYAVGYTNDEFGNNTLKPAVVDNSNAVATGTATSGNTSNWAMKLSAVSGTYSPTIHSTEENSNTYSFTNYHAVPDEYTKVASYSSNTDVATGSSFKSTYAAFISQTQLADSYTGKVKYTVVHPSSELAPIENITQLTYMQDFKDLKADERTAILNSMQYNTTYNLIDSRDNKTYQIARLKDDNIWMAENLDLGRTELTQDLTSQNTNLSTNANTVTALDFNSWIKSSGTSSWTSAELIPLTALNTSNGLDADATSNTPYGTLYNYCATSAGTICVDSNSNNNDTTSDICPAGWRLPTGNTTGELQALYSSVGYNTNAKMRAPIMDGGAAFALAGVFNSSTPASQGSVGYYWSSTRGNVSALYLLSLNTSSVNPAIYNYRHYGYAVRCIAKKPSHALTISYGAGVSSVQVNGIAVQNGGVVNLEEGMPYSITVTSIEGYALSDWASTSGSIKSNTSETTTYTIGSDNATLTANAMLAIQNLDSTNCTSTASQVIDNRDGHVYTIQRLADGRCWMMENLDLGRTTLTKDLTSANTNLADTITATTFNGWSKMSESGTYTDGDVVPKNGIDEVSGTRFGTTYNYYAASAGTISGNIRYSSMQYDICPARWRIPTGKNTGEFQKIYDMYNSYDEIRAPISENGAAFTNGSFWSSTLFGDSYAYYLYVDSSYQADSLTYRNHTAYLRCILDEKNITDLEYMQDFKSLSNAAKTSVLHTMVDSTAYFLIDNRDNKTYQIARLKDNHIWMAENLDLGKTELTTDLTSANTNLDATITASTFNNWKKTSGPTSYTDGGFVLLNGNDSISNTPYGILYNYYTASAGTISGSTNGNNASYDICPSGWQLPSKNAFQSLYNNGINYSSDSFGKPITDGGASFARAGYFLSRNPDNVGIAGYYWSSTNYNGSANMWALSFNSSTVNPLSNYYRNAGYSIRCLVK